MMNRNKGVSKLFIVCILFVCSFILLALSSIITDEEYLLYIKNRHSLNDVKYHIKEIKHDGYTNNDGSSGTTDATNGKGLNLMLIDELEESYARDVLTCLRNSVEGKYDDYDIKLTVEASCGLSGAETGTYPNTDLIKSYLPYVNGQIMWNTPCGTASANEMTLEKFDYSVAAKAGHYDFGFSPTPFQYDTWSGRGIKAKINGAGNSSRTKGDVYYYPDILATNNSYITGLVRNWMNMQDVQQDELSDTWLAFMYGMAHNRGEGGAVSYLYGKYYASGFYVNIDSSYSDEVLELSYSVVSLYTDYRAKYPDAYDIAKYSLVGGDLTIPAAVLAVWNDDWFISQRMANHLKNNINKSVEYWNVLFTNEQITAEELIIKIDNSVATYSEAIKKVTGKEISSEECISVYGADDSDVLNTWGISYNGIVFKVTDIQSTAYKKTYSDGTTPYVIHAMDVICAREAVGACFGDIVYARMLAYAGLANVDPTNPATYYLDGSSLVPTGDMAWMSAYGIDTSKVSVNRANLLQTGYNMVQLKNCQYCHFYKGDGVGEAQVAAMSNEYVNKTTPTRLECAGFVCRAYRDTGFSGFETRMSCGGFIDNNGNIWECIEPQEMEPGDVMVYISGDKGHAMIYLSGAVSSGGPVACTVMESNTVTNTQMNRDGPNIRTVGGYFTFANDTTPTRNGNYYCLRLKTIDTAVTAEKTYEE